MAISEFLKNVRDHVTVADEDELPAETVSELEAEAAADVARADAELDRDPYPADDPDPAPARRATAAKRGRPAPKPKVTATDKKSITDALTMMIDIPAAILSFKDPVCGGAVIAQSDEIVKKLVPIVARNPKLVEWFTSGAGYMDWFGLITALAPVAKTVWTHHVAKRELDPESEVIARHGSAPDFSHYTAPDLAA